MKRKMTSLITIILLCSMITGCNSISTSKKTTDATQKTDLFETVTSTAIMEGNVEKGKVIEIRDTETGVHYYVYRDKTANSGMGGITPRYNADGTLYVD